MQLINSLQIWNKSIPKFEKKYNIIKVVEDFNGLRLVLSSNSHSEEYITLDYTNCSIYSYRNYDESCWLPPLYSYVKVYGNRILADHTFFEVVDSEYKKQISEWGACICLKPDELFHLMVIAGDSIFEIVSRGEPDILQKPQ